MAVHIYTSFSFSYLGRARVLANSVRALHPDWIIWGVVVDEEPADFPHDWHVGYFDKVLYVRQLFEENLLTWIFQHDVVEACTAVKGAALQHILSLDGVSTVLYFDPDVVLFNSAEKIVSECGKHSIVLTPHQITPEPRLEKQAIIDNEICSLSHGAYNLGFLGVKANEEGRRFARWWSDRLSDWCHDRRDIGIFVDQKWCDLIPCFFDEVRILRDPELNVASWNLSHRRVVFDKSGTLTVNGVPLCFFHFTKLGPIGASMTLRYARGNKDVFELWWWYARAVKHHHDAGIIEGWWRYGKFDDGTPIPKHLRELYRSRMDLQSAFPNPFLCGQASLKQWASSSLQNETTE